MSQGETKLELLAKGYSQEEISSTLRLSLSTVSGDLQYINAKLNNKFSEEDIDNYMIEYHTAF